MLTIDTTPTAEWNEIATHLVEALESELPGRHFRYSTTKEGKRVVSEFNPETNKYLMHWAEYRDEKNSLGIFKSFTNKKDFLVARIAMSRTSESYGLRRDGGWLGPFVPEHAMSDFESVSNNDPVAFITEKVDNVFQHVKLIDDLHFAASPSGNIFYSKQDNFSFFLGFSVSPTHFTFKFATELNRIDKALPNTFRFDVSFEQSNELSTILKSKITEFRLSQLFTQNELSFLGQSIQNKFVRYNVDDIHFYQRIVSFLTVQTQLSFDELEILYLESANVPKKQSYINIGKFLLSNYDPTSRTSTQLVYNKVDKTSYIVKDEFHFYNSDETSLYLSTPY